MSILLEVSGVSCEREDALIIDTISFTQQPFQKIVLAGETGSGKSSLLKLIAGLEQPTSGKLIFNGKKIIGPADQLVPGHAKIAYLSQQFELPRFLRVEQVLEYSNSLSEQTSSKIFSICKIDHLLARKTHQLSGGEKQRIAIARLLIQKPKLLLLDEPFSNLDRAMKQTLKTIVDDIGKRLKITCILVSHEPQDTLPWADQIIVLKQGKIVQQGSAKQIYEHPCDSYIASLFGIFNELNRKWIERFAIITSARSIILRPEDFRIVKPSAGAVEGTISNILFMGDHRLLEISLGQKSIFVRTSLTRFQVNESISIMANFRVN